MTSGRRPAPLEERFWAKVEKTETCWLWIGGRDANGYGAIRAKNAAGKWRMARAHRVSFEMAHGPVPDGLLVCHRCDNPPCVNPAHLFVGDAFDNMQGMVAKGRQSRWVPPAPRGDSHWTRQCPERVTRGERVNTARLTSDDVVAIRVRWSRGGVTQQAIADEYGITQAVVSKLLLGRTWRHLPLVPRQSATEND